MPGLLYFFFFNDTATTEIYTLSLHDALPILRGEKTLEDALDLAGGILPAAALRHIEVQRLVAHEKRTMLRDRKSTRLNSSHSQISYAVFCLKKKHKMHRYAEPTSSAVAILLM